MDFASVVAFFFSTPEGVFSAISLVGGGAAYYVKSYVEKRFAEHESTEMECYRDIEKNVAVAGARYDALNTEVNDLKVDIHEMRVDIKEIGRDIKDLIKKEKN